METIQTSTKVALLAPVPFMHLQSGLVTAESKGFVAYGSCAIHVFRELESLRHGMLVDVFIYASHAKGSHEPKVTWHGFYTGYDRDKAGVHPNKMRYRPDSTITDTPDWDIFWKVKELKELPAPQHILIKSLTAYEEKNPYNGFFYPRGPLLIKHPLQKS